MAKPSAHGQAMMRTASVALIARSTDAPAPSQPASVAAATTTTPGTKYAATRSAKRCAPAFWLWASSTSAIIRESWVSRPTRVARTTSAPAGRDRPADHGVAGGDLDRDGLAGHGAGVDLAVTRLHDAVGGDGLAGAHDEAVALLERGGGHAVLDAVGPEQADVLGRDRGQRAQGAAAAAPGDRLEEPAGQQEGDDGAGDVEVDRAPGQVVKAGVGPRAPAVQPVHRVEAP